MPKLLPLLLAAAAPALLAGGEGGAPAGPPQPEGTPEWAVLLLDGTRIGYVKTVEEALPDGGTRSAVLNDMTFRRFGQELRIAVDTTTEEGPDGTLRAFRCVTQNPGAA